MDFIDKLANKVSSGTRILSQKTDEIIEMTELKIELKNIEENIEEEKLYMGELVYKYFLSNNTYMPVVEIKAKCREIQRMEKEKNRMKAYLNKIRGLEYCRICGEPIEEDENYCPKCGYRIK